MTVTKTTNVSDVRVDRYRPFPFAGKPSHVPLISKGPVNTTVDKGQTAQLSCEIHNNSKGVMLLQWVQHHLINDSYEDENGRPYITIVKVTASDLFSFFFLLYCDCFV